MQDKKVTFYEYAMKKVKDRDLSYDSLKFILDVILKHSENRLKKYEKYLSKNRK